MTRIQLRETLALTGIAPLDHSERAAAHALAAKLTALGDQTKPTTLVRKAQSWLAADAAPELLGCLLRLLPEVDEDEQEDAAEDPPEVDGGPTDGEIRAALKTSALSKRGARVKMAAALGVSIKTLDGFMSGRVGRSPIIREAFAKLSAATHANQVQPRSPR